MRLNLGCGPLLCEWPAGFVHVDIRRPCDELVDLSVIPWTWADNSVDEIRCWSVMEHLPNRMAALRECWRILKMGGTLDLRVPHAHGIYAHSSDHMNYWTHLTWALIEQSGWERIFHRVRVRHCHPMPLLDYCATRWPYLWESIGVIPPAMIHWVGKKVAP